ncbi:hypothetical protein E2C01_009101 [Portunus trituberculatus]|uniref:Uncharacterized protein n=1 Tax=Portunus trituberculatus TaxID=210409 RepID=A0A5B7D4J2_PORTR|nr:hypothetical protein [Portunus trituberculatus]
MIKSETDVTVHPCYLMLLNPQHSLDSCGLRMRGQMYAVVSGLLAALASLCGKYAMASTEAQDLCEAALLALHGEKEITTANQISTICDQYTFVLRVVFFVLMVAVNCVMWTTFTKALRFSSTSLEATITNTAANFFFTYIMMLYLEHGHDSPQSFTQWQVSGKMHHFLLLTAVFSDHCAKQTE